MDTKTLFSIDPMAGISYAQYNSIKGGDGSFEDFLLEYDSYNANRGDSGWLFDLIKKEGGFSKLSDPQLLKTLDLSTFTFTANIPTSNFFDIKFDVFKLISQKRLAKHEEFLKEYENFKQLGDLQNFFIPQS